MKTRRKLFFLWICLAFGFLSFGQLEAGEQLPDLEFKTLINSKSPSIRFSDFKGKLVILDFWSFNCVNCIEDFAKLEWLQKKFAGQVQILLVNHEDQKRTVDFFEKRKKLFPRPDLIFITGDEVLSKMFPKDYLPWEVWIDREQRFLFATDAADVTEESIAGFLRKGAYSGNKLIAHTDYDKRKPLFEQTNKKYLDFIQWVSYISKYEDGIDIFGSGFYLYRPGKMRLVKGATNSIEELLVAAFSEDYTRYDFVPNNVSLEVADTLTFRRPANDPKKLAAWLKNCSYNYDCVLPEASAAQAYEIMRQNLVSFFKVSVHIEKRQTKGLALIRIGAEDKLRSKGINGKLPMDNFYTRYNHAFKDFVGELKLIFRGFSIPYSLTDETNYLQNIDIIGLDTRALVEGDIAAFRLELQKYGLDLVERAYLQDVLVIQDK